MKILAAISGLAAMAGAAMAQITVVNTGSVVSPVADDSKTALLSFNAGATANKLIVQVSAEGQAVDSITYQGVALTQAAAGTGRNLGIFYLDNPFTGGAANLSVNLGVGISNGIAIGVVSVAGAAPGVAATALADGARSVTLTVPVSGSFVVSGYAANGNSTITLPGGHTAIYNSTNIGSANAAASYANAQTFGSKTYTYTDTSASPVTSAAVFVPASAPPEITSTIPAAGALAVPPDGNLVATFSEAVVAGSGNIELWQSGGTSPLESFNVATSPQLSFSGPTLTIDPSANLAANTFYYVLIASTAVVDTSGVKAFAGITSPSTWSFSTGNTPPLVPTFSPTDDAFGVALTANLVATFSQTIQKGTGNITIRRADGTVFETINVTSSAVTLSGGKVTINPVNNFVANTGYHVLIDPTALRNTTSLYYAGISDPTVWNFTALPDLTTVDGRLTRMIQNNVTSPWPSTTSSAGMASYVLAAFHLGTDLVTANDYINQFHDQYPVPDSDTIGFDSYFWLHLIWRIYHDPAMNARLTPLARADIEDMMWLFIRTRSRISDAQGDTWVYDGSENHDAMQKGSYLLCAEALKDAPGYGPGRVLADGQTLAQHATAWSGYFQRYFIARAGEGINAEIASPTYAKYSVGVYYNVMDFAESPVLRTLAQRFVTLYWADTASDWTLSGVRGGGEARCYKENYLRLGSQYSFYSLLYGYGWHATSSTVRTYGLIPAASSYRVPALITACAADPARPNYLYTSRRFGRAGSVVGDNNFIIFDSGNSNLRRDTWVTPDYTMGTLTFDMNRDYVQILDQSRAMGVMFASGPNNRVMVFGQGAASNNKSYADLSGVTRADCMVVQRDQNANNTGSGTLVFVPNALWNARVETGGWLFLQTGNAYCAVRPAGGTYSAVTAAHGVDLAMSNIWAPVIIQMGQKANYADFAAFQASVIANALTFVSNTLNYTSEAGDTFTFYANSKTTPRVNGTTVNLNPTKTYDSPYLSMTHGTDLATVSYPGYQNLLLNFDPASTSFIGVNASTQRYQSTAQTTNTITNFTVPSGSNRKLVLFASWESGNRGISATWNGTQNFTAAVNSTSDRNAAILYLDAPTAGTGNIVVTFPGSTSSRVGVLSLVGVAPGVARTTTSSGRSGSLNHPVDGSFVAGVYTSNGLPTINGPFSTTLYNGDSGSCAGNAGYQVMLSVGTANHTWSVTNPLADSYALAAFVPASAAPVMLSTSPADNATGVAIAANLVANFSEPVLRGTGTITIKRTSDNSTVESFNAATSPALTFSGQSLTINPTADLDFLSEYYVLIDATAVIDNSGGNAFAGISDPMAWNFTADNTGAIFVKANNSNHLALGSSWVGGVAPTFADRAKWDSTVTSSNTTSLGADLTFGGIVIANPTGPVTINPGNTLALGAGLVDIDLSAATQDLTLNCNLAMQAPNVWDVTSGRTLALGGVVSGSTGVTKQGVGTAILSNANGYTGGTAITAGTLKLSGAGTPGAPGSSVAVGAGALLDLNGSNQSIAFAAGTGAGTVANNAGSGTSTLTMSANPSANVIIQDFTTTPGGKVAVVVTVNSSSLNAANTYSGGTTVNPGAYLYYFTSDSQAGTGPINLTAGTGSTATSSGLLVNGITVANDITGAGYVHINANPGTAVFTGTLNTSGTFNFRNAASVFNFAGSGNSTLSGVIGPAGGSGVHGPNITVSTGSVIKSGTGTLTLSGNNLYTGSTTVSGGTLALLGGSQASPITVQDGATLGFDIAAPTSSTKAVTLNAGHKISVSGSPTLPSYTLLTTSATITGAEPNLNPAIPGYDLIVDGTNTLKLVATAPNSFASWISNPAFGLALADQDLGDDPDGDGIGNGVENFFGTNPGTFSQGLVIGTANPGAGTFTFTHPQNATPASDLTASYRWSKDLTSFLASGATDGAGTTVAFTTQADTPSPGITTVTATVTGTATSNLFVRVNVTQP